MAMRFVLLLLALLPQGIDAPRITQQEFKKLIAAKNVVIVDTRSEDRLRSGHIPGAVMLPLEGRLTWPESYRENRGDAARDEETGGRLLRLTGRGDERPCGAHAQQRGVKNMRALVGGWNHG